MTSWVPHWRCRAVFPARFLCPPFCLLVYHRHGDGVEALESSEKDGAKGVQLSEEAVAAVAEDGDEEAGVVAAAEEEALEDDAEV